MDTRRNLVVGAVSLVKCRIKGDGQAALAARNEIEGKLVENGFLSSAAFKTVSLILRYGNRDNIDTEIGKVDVRNGVLPVAVELQAERIQGLSPEELTEEFRTVMIEVLSDVAAHFDLPGGFLDQLRKLH